MRRVFKTRHFARWMRKTELTDVGLCQAVQEMAADLLARSVRQLDESVADGTLQEICHDD
ncbi:MAG: type II toxin-antitoxin system RelE/ParE family toxin [Pseudomonadota bacterium]|jgi:hypothetical protein